MVYRADESEEDEEEAEGIVIGGLGDEVSIMPAVYPRGTVSVSSLDFFHMLVLLLLNSLVRSRYRSDILNGYIIK